MPEMDPLQDGRLSCAFLAEAAERDGRALLVALAAGPGEYGRGGLFGDALSIAGAEGLSRVEVVAWLRRSETGPRCPSTLPLRRARPACYGAAREPDTRMNTLLLMGLLSGPATAATPQVGDTVWLVTFKGVKVDIERGLVLQPGRQNTQVRWVNCYNCGDWVPTDHLYLDIEAARRHHESLQKDAWMSSCEGGRDSSCDSLRSACRNHATGRNGWPLDPQESAACLSRLCSLGDAISCRDRAAQTLEGLLGAPDPTGALALYDQGCKQRDYHACFRSAELILDGVSPTRDRDDGVVLLRKACRMKSKAACTLLEETLVVADYRNRCFSGYERYTDCRDLAAAYGDGGQLGREPVERDLDAALEVLDYMRDGDWGSGTSENRWAAGIAASLLNAEQPDRASEYRRQACELGDEKACALLQAQALLAAREADCDAGDGEACRAIGSTYEHGESVYMSRSTAYAAYARGCEARDLPSCQSAITMMSEPPGVSLADGDERLLDHATQACELDSSGKQCLVSARLQLGLGLPSGHDAGLVVVRVLPDSPAARAGVKRGDLLLSYHGVALRSGGDLRRAEELCCKRKETTTLVLSRKLALVTLQLNPAKEELGVKAIPPGVPEPRPR
jgi:TPR repeat protein